MEEENNKEYILDGQFKPIDNTMDWWDNYLREVTISHRNRMIDEILSIKNED